MRASRLHLVALAGLTLAACAHRAGSRATAGAVEQTQEKLAELEAEDPSVLGERLARGFAQGFLGELAKQEYQQHLGVILGNAMGEVLLGASRPPAGTGGTGGAGPASGSPVGIVSAQAAQAFAAAFSAELARQVGPDGQGPLGRALASAGEGASASLVRGARDELGPLFPECAGADRSTCVRARIAELASVTSSGVVGGVRSSLGLLPFLLTFAAGAVTCLVAFWGWALYRSRHRPA